MEPFIGEIKLMAINFAPKGWALCNGQIMQVSGNQALFALIGNRYGGDGTTTFALPDLRGRTPVHYGALPMGRQGGSETIALTTAQVPQHSHKVGVCPGAGNKSNAAGFHIAAPVTSSTPSNPLSLYAAAGAPNPVALDQTATAPTVSIEGAGAGHSNMQPYTVLNYCIATAGIYPARN